MSFLVVVGCDGSGKSTVLEQVVGKLRDQGEDITCGHWRPTPFSKSVNHHAVTADDPHGQEVRGIISSVMKLGWIWINWWVGWLWELRKQSRQGFVFYDRYHGDLLVDPQRYRYGGPMWLAELWSRTLPQPDHLIFLDAEVDVLLARKQEVSADALAHSRAGYLELVKRRQGTVVDANRPIKEIINELRFLLDQP